MFTSYDWSRDQPPRGSSHGRLRDLNTDSEATGSEPVDLRVGHWQASEKKPPDVKTQAIELPTLNPPAYALMRLAPPPFNISRVMVEYGGYGHQNVPRCGNWSPGPNQRVPVQHAPVAPASILRTGSLPCELRLVALATTVTTVEL